MAQIECRRYVGSPSGGYDRHGHWSPPGTPSFSYLYENEDHHHGKKSILMKVKEKARKWKQVLTRKRHGNDSSDDSTPPWGVSLDETDVEDPEYHGAPSNFSLSLPPSNVSPLNLLASVYESEMAQDACKCQPSQKHAACQLHCADKKYQPTIVNKESEMKEANDLRKPPGQNNLRAIREKTMFEIRALPPADDSISQQKDKPALQIPAFYAGASPLREKITEMIAPAYVMISDATHVIATKIQESRPGCEMAARKVWCKSVAVKESLMQKLQPREEDRALCQVITEAVSPRSGARDQNKEAGVVEKVKEAVSSLMAKEEPHGSSAPMPTNPFSDDADDGGKDLQARIS